MGILEVRAERAGAMVGALASAAEATVEATEAVAKQVGVAEVAEVALLAEVATAAAGEETVVVEEEEKAVEAEEMQVAAATAAAVATMAAVAATVVALAAGVAAEVWVAVGEATAVLEGTVGRAVRAGEETARMHLVPRHCRMEWSLHCLADSRSSTLCCSHRRSLRRGASRDNRGRMNLL